MTRSTRRELEIADHLWDCLSRIAEDHGTDPQVVLNQAVYDLARRFNFLAPAPKNRQPMHQAPAAPAPAPAPAPVAQAPAKKAAPVAPPPKAAPVPPALFVVTGSGESTKVDKDAFLIGRSRNCDLVVPSSKVSRQHCSVSRDGADYYIEDLGSPNGVWRDGVKITKEKIKDGDEFMISDEVLKFVFKAAGRK